ncbi:MAG: GIY-YIG nuclease family protein [Chloroflexi bacterium]|nr:MAG: GIY-YIG nuclease family protein [Chloroflexota bacterium]
MAVTVYVLRCADGTLYTGWTTNIERRLREHNAGRGAKYTRSRTPVQLAYTETHPDRASAQRREIEIKRLSRRQKLALINQ